MVALSFLVPPVRRDAEFRIEVHVMSAYLHFEGFAPRTHDRGMQGLVYAKPWGGNVVFKPPWHGRIESMNGANGGVTVVGGIHKNADTHQIENLVEVAATDNHLLVDGPVVFRPTHDLCGNVVFLHGGRHLVDDFRQVTVT